MGQSLAPDPVADSFLACLKTARHETWPFDYWLLDKALSEQDCDDIAKLPRIKMLGKKAPLLVVDGAYRGRGGTIKDARMLAIVCPLDGATVFVKMLGPRKAVMQHEPAFRSFCSSMK